MNAAAKELADRAELLPDEEGAAPVASILRGLKGPYHEVTDEEVTNRMAEAEANPSVLLDEDEFREGLKRRGGVA